MAKHAVDILLRGLRALASGQAAEGQSDQHLLERFVRQRDEAAFAALLERHGPMVLGVCRRALHDDHLAEDVLQATFLVLARNAGAIRKRPSLGGWLHGVALRLARKARAEAGRAGRGDARPRPEPPSGPAAEASWREVRQILDDELQRLPESYRLPLVLCYLEGRTRDEAAAELGWTPGRLKGLLERGRERLRGRLIQRGLAPAAAGAVLLAETALAAPVPPLLAVATLRAALRLAAGIGLRECGLSGTVLGLTEGGFGIMGSKKVLLFLVLALGLSVLGTGTGFPAPRPGPAVARVPAKGTGKPDPDKPKDNKEAAWREKATFKTVAPQSENWWKPGGLFPAFVQFAPNGKRLATGRLANLQTFALLELATAKDVTARRIAEDGRIENQFLGFTPDGKAWGFREVAAGPALVGFAVVDWVSGQERSRVTEKGRWRVALSPDGKVLAGLNVDGKVKLWNAATGRELAVLASHRSDYFSGLAISPNGKTLATANFPRKLFQIHVQQAPEDDRADITLWDVATGKAIAVRTLKGSNGSLGMQSTPSGNESARAMRFTLDGRRLAIAGNVILPGQPYPQTVLRLWDVDGLKESGRFQSKDYGSLRDYAFSPDGKTIAVAWMGATVSQGPGQTTVYAPAPVTILDRATGKEVARLPPPRSGYAAVAFARDGTLLATQDNEGIVKVWERTSTR